MPKHIFRLSLFVVLLALGGSIRAKEVVFIGTSMKTLAGLYKVTVRLCLRRPLNFDSAERKRNFEGF